MVHYIRFLRTPQVGRGKKTIDIAAVVAVTTDLGDAYYAEDVDLLVEVTQAHGPHQMLHSQVVKWTGGSRASKFALCCEIKDTSLPVRLHVTTDATAAAIAACHVPKLLDAWSDSFALSDKQRAEPMVERQILLPNMTCLRIWEETGDSIARHIWDASLGFLLYFRQGLQTPLTPGVASFQNLLQTSKVRRLQVLELGAGCGIVGIALAQLVKCDLLLTDLEDAEDILARNVQSATPAPGSTLQAEVLAWGSGLSDRSNTKFDLVLVSDCIYNPDSSLHLVETLRQLAAHSRHVLILVGFKRRHEADTIFFQRMQDTDFEVIETCHLPLPHSVTEQDATWPTVEFYAYRLASLAAGPG